MVKKKTHGHREEPATKRFCFKPNRPDDFARCVTEVGGTTQESSNGYVAVEIPVGRYDALMNAYNQR